MEARVLYSAGAAISVTWLTPILALTTPHWALNYTGTPLTAKRNAPGTAAQIVIVGLAFFAAAPAVPALPATKAVLPMAITGAISSNRAECFRVLLCTIFSSHQLSPHPHPLFAGPGTEHPPHTGDPVQDYLLLLAANC